MANLKNRYCPALRCGLLHKYISIRHLLDDPGMTKAILYAAIGGNLFVEGYDTLLEGLEAAANMLPKAVFAFESSLWYQTAAVPVSDQPDFLNAVFML